MSLASGTRIGVYEITGSLGGGGIGEVYRARDTRLNRDVAAKVLPELIDGPTLADRIAQGPLHVAEALELAKQIADALDAAHEKGIVHRDRIRSGSCGNWLMA